MLSSTIRIVLESQDGSTCLLRSEVRIQDISSIFSPYLSENKHIVLLVALQDTIPQRMTYNSIHLIAGI